MNFPKKYCAPRTPEVFRRKRRAPKLGSQESPTKKFDVIEVKDMEAKLAVIRKAMWL